MIRDIALQITWWPDKNYKRGKSPSQGKSVLIAEKAN